MPTFLFTWSPKDYEQLADDYQKWVRDGSVLVPDWSTGTSKSVPNGARIFVMRQRSNQGIVAAGVTASILHSPGRSAQNLNDIDIRINEFGDPENPLILMDELLKISGEKKHWQPRMSGTKMDEEIAQKLESAWRTAWSHRKSALSV